MAAMILYCVFFEEKPTFEINAGDYLKTKSKHSNEMLLNLSKIVQVDRLQRWLLLWIAGTAE